MKDTLITISTAKLAKEKGFNEVVDEIYDTYNSPPTLDYHIIYNANELKHSDDNKNHFVSAPTQSLLQRWLREEHNIEVNVIHIGGGSCHEDTGEVYKLYKCSIFPNYKQTKLSYEEALEQGLKEALKLLK